MIRGFNFEKQFNNILDSFNIDRYCKKYQKNKIRLSREAESSLLTYDFPGNIRELENAMQRAVTLAERGIIKPHYLPASISLIPATNGKTTKFSTLTEAKRHAAEQAEREFVCDCLQTTK
jgi:DNA-binding NtrC family response regulator